MIRRTILALAPLLAACAPRPVAWAETVALAGPVPDEARLTLAGDAARLDTVPALAGAPAAVGCPATLRLAALGAGPAYAAWWTARPDSSAELLVARSDDGGRTWSAAAAAESRDRATLGCARPAPAVAVDPAGGSVHVAYWAVLPEGPGIFFSHATGRTGLGAPALPPEHYAHMPRPAGDSGTTAGAPDVLWHAAVAVVHGERPSRAALAVHGDTVAVAFEDPNSGPRPRIALAWSRQMGHVFDLRDHEVSTPDAPAREPLVALRGNGVAVAWREEGRAGRFVRVGTVQGVRSGE